MARVSLFLSIVFVAIAATLGFLTKGKVEELNKAITERTATLTTTKATLKKTQEDLKATQDELATTKTQLEEKTAELATAKKELDDSTKKLADVTAQLEEKTTAMAALQEQLKVLIDQSGGKDLKEVIEQMKNDLAKAQAELAEAKQVNDSLAARVKEKEDALATSERTVNAYKWNVVKNELSGKVLAYNSGWNFVVLSIGDKAGLKPGVNMVVQRGNTMIAKVKVTTVEPNTAIADVVGGSMRGVKIEPGDTVIYQGPRQ